MGAPKPPSPCWCGWTSKTVNHAALANHARTCAAAQVARAAFLAAIKGNRAPYARADAADAAKAYLEEAKEQRP